MKFGFVWSIAVAAVLLGCQSAGTQDAATTLKRASDAMGATNLKSIRYTAEGTGYTFGQAFKPGMPWPKITLHSQIRTINYDTASMRDEVTLSRAEPRGGGGYPLAGQQRNDQFVSGVHAWNQAAAGPVPGPRFIADRTHQLWITPHGAVKAAIKNNATHAGQSAVTFTEPNRFIATVFFNADSLVERVESRAPDAVLGETTVVTTYSDYRDFGGVKFPMRIQQTQSGAPVLDVVVKEVQPNAAADIQLPDAVRTATERVTVEKVADGIWFIAGATHNSVAIEMKDHIVMVEAPLFDGRTLPVIEQVKQLAPGKPIRYVINSHEHFDHAGGLRAAAAEGATIVAHGASKSYLEKAFATPNKINPDRLTQSGRKAQVLAVTDKLVMNDGARTLEIHSIRDSVHSDAFLMVYLPKEKLLIEADAYTPSPPNTPPPAQPNANNVNLVENIERLKLSIDRILPLHGRVVPLSELYTAVGKSAPK
ncbi:MAG TPA: MBL fold metallo-hydrolase [Burkholderiaceae bacterium]|nr:MBL fold metallo-hydrolase [Burkholderiaceae bacterium]